MKKFYHFFFFFFICLSVLSQPEISLDLYGTGFSSPVAIQNAGDDRLFIVERAGRIKIINSNGSINVTPFLDIDSIVDNAINPGQEGGLLGLAFHPDYQSNGFFYVNYTNNSGDTVISRYTVSLNPDLANSNSQQILLTIDQPYSNHNGGDIAFGPDGYLYIGTGDGGSGGDPQNRAQNLNSLLGKMLRLDVDSGSPYAIPSDNPYLNDGDSSTLSEIWAYGLRNPWRFSFDSQTGDLWTADVGQGTYEEINRVSSAASGINYGWRCYEANATYNTSGCPPMNSLTFPIGTYSHSGGPYFRCSISGGYVYRGSDNPNFFGIYFFADYCSNEIGTLAYDGNNWNMSFTSPFSGQGFVSFGNDVDGELYIAGMNSGNIYKLIDSTLGIDYNDDHSFSMFPNPAHDELTFDFKNTLPLEMYIYDIQGKVVHSMNDFKDLTFSFSVGQFSEGLYVVKVQDANGLVSYQKLLIK